MSAISSGFLVDAPRRDDEKTPLASSRFFPSTKKKSHRRSELPRQRRSTGKRRGLGVVRTRRSRRRERAIGLGARRRRARRGLRGGRHARGPPAPDLDARAGRRRDGRGWKMSSRSRLAIFQRPRLLACDATDARPRPREDARRERRGRTKPNREERAARDAAFRATTQPRVRDRVATRRRSRASRLRVSPLRGRHRSRANSGGRERRRPDTWARATYLWSQ